MKRPALITILKLPFKNVMGDRHSSYARIKSGYKALQKALFRLAHKYQGKLTIVYLKPPFKPMTIASIAPLIFNLVLGIMTFLFIFRIILTWYPQIELRRFPFTIVALSTEPFLVPTRKIVPPIGGVDISPIIWVGIVTLVREILLGQQGILTMALR